MFDLRTAPNDRPLIQSDLCNSAGWCHLSRHDDESRR
jgi:hypothetical protein